MEKILEVTDLGIAFGSNVVLRNLTFSVEKGEILGIIGPNGAGKTVLLNLISGMLTPSTGKVVFEGQDITKWSVVKRALNGIGRTFQVPRPFELMTTYENIMTGALFAGGISQKDAAYKATEVIQLIGMMDRAGVMGGKLGLLERKRLEIGVALASDPRLILLDEVAGGLTEVEIGEMLKLVEKIRNMGITIIWIEHILETMVKGTDRVMCLAGGDIVASGKPMEVLNSPKVKEVYLGVDEDE